MVEYNKAIFLSYNGLLEPILASQVIPYLEGLTRSGWYFILITYEKRKDIDRVGRGGLSSLKNSLLSKGIDWRYLRYHKRPRIVSTLFDICVGAIYTFFVIARNKIKIVHVRGATPGVIMILLSGIMHVKLLFDMRGRLAEEMAAGGLWREGGVTFKLVKKAEEALLNKADAVTVLTKKHFDLNRESACFKDRNIPMDVIPCCVDMSKFYYDPQKTADFKKRLGLTDKFILMYQGKVGTFYFIDHMLDFFKVMHDIMPNSVFLILTRDDTAAVLSRAAAIGISEDDIKVARDIEFDRIPQYMRIADAGIFFINAYNKLGSSPIKMGEFLASGVPVIISPGVGDTEELVIENSVGIVVKEFADSQYRDGVKALLKLKQEGEGLSRRCVDAAKEYLSVEDGVNKYYQIYKTLLKDQ